MAVVLALCAALGYGLSDFVGGLVSRRTAAWSVAVVGQLSSALSTTAVAAFFPGNPTWGDFGWAALAGSATGLGTAFLYRGFATGRLSVVAPISAVGAAVVPVLAGTLGGEQLTALVWAGIVVALPAIWLVARPGPDALEAERAAVGASDASARQAVTDGILAGLGFGVLFAALGQVPESAGLWPLAAAQALSIPTVVLLAVAVGARWVPRGRTVWWALTAGPLGAAAAGAFLLSSQSGYLTVAGVLASLHPATTVALAALLLGELVHRSQGVGLGLCAVAIVLMVAGG